MGMIVNPYAFAAPYIAIGNDFDGTNDFATRGADLTGIADGKQGTFDWWIRLDGGDSSTQRIFLIDGIGMAVNRTSTNKIQFFSDGFSYSTTPTYLAGSAWIHILASWDLALAQASRFRAYIDDAEPGWAAAGNSDVTIDYTTGNAAIGAQVDGGSKFNGCMSEMFFHTTYIDLDVEANRRKFRTAAGKPANKGADGSIPLGVQPLIYIPNGISSANLGSGGNFTINGTPTVCTSSPSD